MHSLVLEALQQRQALSHLFANECLHTMFTQDAALINQLTDSLHRANLYCHSPDFSVSGGTEMITNGVTVQTVEEHSRF